MYLFGFNFHTPIGITFFPSHFPSLLTQAPTTPGTIQYLSSPLFLLLSIQRSDHRHDCLSRSP